MRHRVIVFYCTFVVFLYNVVSGQLALLLLINNNNFVCVNFCTYLGELYAFSGSPSLCYILFYWFFFSLYCILYSWLIN